MARRKKVKRKPAGENTFLMWLPSLVQNQIWDGLRRRSGWAFVGLLLAGVVVASFYYMERYVDQIAEQRDLQYSVELANPPDWLGRELIEEICFSTEIKPDDFILDNSLSDKWAENLARNPWIKRVNLVHKRHDGHVILDCEIRRPIASFEQTGEVYYIDQEGIVLPAAPIRNHLVRLDGPPVNHLQPGEPLEDAKLIAGLEVLQLILQVDEQMPQSDQIWAQLASIDVSNYQGRLDPMDSHLTLYTRGNTPIHWGAAVGESTANYEAKEKIKLTNLYRQYKQTGSLDRYQYVELRNFRKEKADPLKPPRES